MKTDRRTFLGTIGLAAAARQALGGPEEDIVVNDIHAQLSRTRVHDIVTPRRADDVAAAIETAARRGRAVSVCGGRHAMGGQQFGTDTTLIDVRELQRVRRLDPETGLVEVEAGIQWPALIEALAKMQRGVERPWAIRTKQTGADRLTLAGALSANIHGRSLTRPPFVSDVEAFTLVDATGRSRRCSRTENAEWFRLAAGGYGLFGVITTVTLRLARRHKVRRVVEIGATDELCDRIERRIADGYEYGDFQFAIDPSSDDFLRKGVFACYQPAADSAELLEGGNELSGEDWGRLIRLAHVDKTRAFRDYAAYYLATSGQVYWSDTHQLSFYLDGYHGRIDAEAAGTEMLSEVYVPRPRLESLLTDLRRAFRSNGVSIPYGTIRFIEKDDETFLPWARDRYACVVFNLHVPRAAGGEERTADAFRTLIDLALAQAGTYYLTYHRYARRDQVLAGYPRLPEFLAAKRRLDPDERFQSDWYRHHRRLLAPDRSPLPSPPG
jgi:FAD/FMN-containing dehydrogenase